MCVLLVLVLCCGLIHNDGTPNIYLSKEPWSKLKNLQLVLCLWIIKQRLLATGRENARMSLSLSPMLSPALVSGLSLKSKSGRWISQLVVTSVIVHFYSLLVTTVLLWQQEQMQRMPLYWHCSKSMGGERANPLHLLIMTR